MVRLPTIRREQMFSKMEKQRTKEDSELLERMFVDMENQIKQRKEYEKSEQENGNLGEGT